MSENDVMLCPPCLRGKKINLMTGLEYSEKGTSNGHPRKSVSLKNSYGETIVQLPKKSSVAIK